jgi:hypothetical protein
LSNGPLLQLPLAQLSKLQQLSLTDFDLLLLLPPPAVLPASGSDAGAGQYSSSSKGRPGSSSSNASEAAQGSDTGGVGGSGNGGSSSIRAAGDLGGAQQQLVGLRDLQELRLQECRLPSPYSLAQLAAAATGLTYLSVEPLNWFDNESRCGNAKYSLRALKGAVSSMLQQHQQLSVLQLPGIIPLGHTAAQHLCPMGMLTEVSVCLASGLSASRLADLPSSITRLRVDNNRNREDYRPAWGEDNASDVSEEDSDAPWQSSRMQLQQLTGLVDLGLHYVAFSAAELAGATQMQRLMLKGCTLLPQGERDPAEGTSALLTTLAGYKQLQQIRFSELELAWNCRDLVSLERFAALTASPELTYLEVRGEYGVAPLPSGALQHMFPPGQNLPLRELVLLPHCGREPYFIADYDSFCMTGGSLFLILSKVVPSLDLLPHLRDVSE